MVLAEGRLLAEVAGTETPQGLLAVARRPHAAPGSAPRFFLVADRIQDPGNLGTMIRTAHAAGAGGVLTTPGTVDPYGAKVIRATAGSLFHLPVVEAGPDWLGDLRRSGIVVLAAAAGQGVPMYQADMTRPCALVVGNEGSGCGEEVLRAADVLVSIPMPGGAESLNAAVAAAILLYEAVRQRREQCREQRREQRREPGREGP